MPYVQPNYSSTSYTLPAPLGGMNDRVPIDKMDEGFCVEMINYFPDRQSVNLRSGYSVFETITAGTSDSILTLAEHIAGDGTKTFLCAIDNGVIYDITTGTASAVGSGFNENRWQYVNYFGYLVLVSGQDTPQHWNGTTLGATSITGSGLTASDLIQVSVYKSRLYFVEKQSANVWYSGAAADPSASMSVTAVDYSTVTELGGPVAFTSSWTYDAGGGLEDFFVIVTLAGEVLIYSGDNPGAAAWTIVGRYRMPSIPGAGTDSRAQTRCYTKVGNDIVITTETGVVSLSALVKGAGQVGDYYLISNNIQGGYVSLREQHPSNRSQVFYWPKGKMLIVTVGSVLGQAYVMNVETGAWCLFDAYDGENSGFQAGEIGIFKDDMYFAGPGSASTSKNINKYDGDTTDKSTSDGSDAGIQGFIRFSYNYFGDRTRNKRILTATPLLSGPDTFTPTLDVNIDFSESLQLSDFSNTSSGDGNNDTYHNNVYSVDGVGRTFSLIIAGIYKDSPHSIFAIQTNYEPGGYL